MGSMGNKVTSTTKIRMLAVLASIFFCAGQIALAGQSTAPKTDLDNGINLLNARKFNEAIQVLKKITRTNKTEAEAWYYLGTAYIHTRDFKKAITCLETANSCREGFAEAHVALSYALLRRGK